MDRVTEHVAAHPYYLKGVADERERIIQIVNDRLQHVKAIAAKMGELDDVQFWPPYVQGVFLELDRLVEVLNGNLPVVSDKTL